MTSGGVALWVAVLSTPFLIRWLLKHNIGQQIREDGPQVHIAKAGTPTMGGIGIVAAVVVGYLAAHAVPGVTFSRSGALIMLALVGAASDRLADDWIKVRHRRSLGLNKRAKFGAQIGLGVLFSLLAVYWAHATTTLSFTRYDSIGFHMGTGLWVVWATVVIVASANAVNLTDGLDGLAAGSSTFCFACLAIIGYWQYRHFAIYHVVDALDLALAAVALAGACLGFLWWNAAPAKIFMGDTGSLSIGAALAALCLLMNLDLLLVDHRWPVRHRHPVGGHPGGELPGLPPSGLPHGPAAPPFRTAGMARDHRDRPVLDPGRPLRRPRPGHLLRGLPVGGEGLMARLHHPEAPVDEARGMDAGAGEVGDAGGVPGAGEVGDGAVPAIGGGCGG